MTSGDAAARLFAAVDTSDPAAAAALCGDLGDSVGGIKLGLEFFVANGPVAVRAALVGGQRLFLDLKFHDIPNTVAGAVRSACALEPELLTIHAAGGPAMIEAARRAAEETAGAARPRLIAVTVLTSLGDEDLDKTGQRGPAADQVLRLARLARESGADGAVCSPLEAAALRAALGPDFLLVVPGVRTPGSAADDQKRVMTPRDAIAAGADRLVVGRPITRAQDPAAAARAIAKGMAGT
ncbi:MAG: orotidine-5'-phosphate decarboxylase [Rhodospirillaceae bacterium]|jgi:orotidine-5'-phosphate decarboxylase|nr:orotidine-5'-phosphate decarboxylase [Rhodospirillaceae bacterium]MBT6116972.1 orotidine-5'-phosphate decarboxylase [Rhodospirillaceae bacterium]